MVILIIVLILISGCAKEVSEVTMSLDKFVSSLSNVIQTVATKDYDSVKKLSFTLPENLKEVCFFDKNQPVTIQGKITPDQENNIFLSPAKQSFKVSEFIVEKEKNPLCLSTPQGKLDLRLISKKGKTQITEIGDASKKGECSQVLYNGDENQKLDIVFVGQEFKKLSDFIKDVNHFVNDIFFEIEPFKSNKDKVNFHRIDKFPDMGCTFDDYILCEQFKVKKEAAQCPNDFIVVLVKRNRMQELTNPLRSTAISNIVHINTADKDSVLMHELGHAIGGLADEYLYEREIKFNVNKYPNCDVASCPTWAQEQGLECLPGCTYQQYNRPTETSLMKELEVFDFGSWNKKIIEQKLGKFK